MDELVVKLADRAIGHRPPLCHQRKSLLYPPDERYLLLDNRYAIHEGTSLIAMVSDHECNAPILIDVGLMGRLNCNP